MLYDGVILFDFFLNNFCRSQLEYVQSLLLLLLCLQPYYVFTYCMCLCVAYIIEIIKGYNLLCSFTVMVCPGTRWAATTHPVCKSELKYSTVYLYYKRKWKRIFVIFGFGKWHGDALCRGGYIIFMCKMYIHKVNIQWMMRR